MNELDIGSEVIINGGANIRARIRAIEIRGPQRLTSYQCVWWDERTLKSEWLYSDELELANTANRKIGLTPKT
jgi:hypothetical protein